MAPLTGLVLQCWHRRETPWVPGVKRRPREAAPDLEAPLVSGQAATCTTAGRERGVEAGCKRATRGAQSQLSRWKGPYTTHSRL